MTTLCLSVEIADPDFGLIDSCRVPLFSRGTETCEAYRLNYIAMDASGAVHAFNLPPVWDEDSQQWLAGISDQKNQKSHVTPIRSFKARIIGAEQLCWKRPAADYPTKAEKPKSRS
jgi:hypothetical protein